MGSCVMGAVALRLRRMISGGGSIAVAVRLRRLDSGVGWLLRWDSVNRRLRRLDSGVGVWTR